MSSGSVSSRAISANSRLESSLQTLIWSYTGTAGSHKLTISLITGEAASLIDIEIDGVVQSPGRAVRKMLELLALRRGTVVTKEMLYKHLRRGSAWKEPSVENYNVFLSNLRSNHSGRFKLDAPGDTLFSQVWGRGIVMRRADGEKPPEESPRPPPHRANYVKGLGGEIIVLNDLKPDNFKRWFVRCKAEVITAIRGSLISEEEALAWYNLSVEELATWQRRLHEHGLKSLGATKARDNR